jgi:hypothetical protein
VEALSAACTTYVDDVAPAIDAHEAPLSLQRCHWNEKVGAVWYVHVPVVVVSVCPLCAVPEITGGAVFVGA